MRVALDISPTISGHSSRGIGSYTRNLKDTLKNSDIELIYISNPKEEVKADIYHSPYFDFFENTLNLHKNAKNIVTIHDAIPLLFPTHFPSGIRGKSNLFFQKKKLSKVDAIITDSNSSKKDIINTLKIPEKKIFVIYLAASGNFKVVSNQNALQNTLNKYGLPSKFVIYVGDVNWNKNIPGLLKATRFSNVNLVMTGKSLIDNSLPQVNEMNKLINDLNIKSKVFKLGFIPIEDLVHIYNMAEATVVPSFYEGFGLPVLESMACGTPVICSNNSSLSEVGKLSAIFCDENDPKDIASKIEAIIKLSQKEKLALSKKLINHANNYSWNKVADQTKAVYRSVLSPKINV